MIGTTSFQRVYTGVSLDSLKPQHFKVRPGTFKNQSVMSFEKGNKADGRHYWLTPPDMYSSLNNEFCFDFDPCPFPVPEGFDGLNVEWGNSNYVNPPFGSYKDRATGKKKGPTAWAKKAISEFEKGKRIVLVYPVDGWIMKLIASGCVVRNLGLVNWLATEDGRPGRPSSSPIAAFILDPANPVFVDRGGLILNPESGFVQKSLF